MSQAAATLKGAMRRVLAGGLGLTRDFARSWRGRVIILTYHRVVTADETRRHPLQPGMFVLEQVFERQMRFVQEHLRVLSLSELLSRWRERELRPEHGYCVVTFDDGWADNYTCAYPILRALGIPASIFLTTAYVGTDRWFWPERLVYLLARRRDGGRRGGTGGRGPEWSPAFDREIAQWKRLPLEEIETRLERLGREVGCGLPEKRLVLSWPEVVEMSRGGVAFGSHSRTHAILTGLDRRTMGREVEDSLAELRRPGVSWLPVFCYPDGSYDDAVVERVKAAGYTAALSADFGWEGASPADVFAIRRVGIHNDIAATPALFAFHLAGLNRLMSRK